jgi:hypothetical protein
MLNAVDIFLGAVFFIFGLFVTIRLNNTRTKLDGLEWLARTQKADVVIFFKTDNMLLINTISEKGVMPILNTHLYRRLIVKNVGQREATNIEISLRDNDDKELNNETGFRFWKEILPIKILAPGLEVSYPFDVSPDIFPIDDIINESVIGYWNWKNPDGSTDSRESNLDFFGMG